MKKIFFIIAFGCAIILSSCTYSRYIYTASPANNPYFTEKGQSKLTGYYSNNADEDRNNGDNNTKSKADGVDVQAAYAISKNWALTTSFYHRNEKDFTLESSENHFVHYKRDLFEVGGGAFLPLNKRKSLTVNFFAGLAFGRFSFTDQNISQGYDRFHNAAITKFYFQPSFNYILDEYFRIGLILKPVFVHYGNIQSDYTEGEKESYGLNLIENNTVSFFEQEWNIQLGLPQIPWIKLDAALSTTNPFLHDIQSFGSVRGGNVSIGLTFDFSKMKKKSE